jgi:hypothetical protein
VRKLPVLLALALLPLAAARSQESRLHADLRGEGERFKQSCADFSLKAVPGCAELLFTDHPLHIAVGSIAPQNGFGAGAALVGNWTPNESWRTSWNFDAIGSSNGSWRAGGYLKLISTPPQKITVTTTASGNPKHSSLSVHAYPVFNLDAQAISLNTLYYYGLGPNSLATNRSAYGETETIVGANTIVPVPPLRSLDVSLLGEVNGRFVAIRPDNGQSSPSIKQIFNESTAPGLATQPGFAQFGEGIRIEPTLFNDHFQIDYLAQLQEFVAGSNSHYSFRRFTADLNHTIPLYKTSGSYGPKSFNGPDACAISTDKDARCPSIQRNREGSIGVRLFITESIAGAGSVVPFYFQQTLGGSDMNGNAWLSSYDDYRFRAPNAILLRESFEHSLWGPIGFTFSADQGKVALTRGDVAFDHLAHSFSAGLTVRAGGLPALSLAVAWAGPQGPHTIATVDTSLLGGSLRPSLF